MRLTLNPELFHRIGIVFNPTAGGLKGGGLARLHAAIRTFEAAGAKVEQLPTAGPNHAGELARKAAEAGCSLILAAGGDGTINEVINGIAGMSVPFGPLPSGTANVLANEIGLANRPDRAAPQILQCRQVPVTLGRLDRAGLPSRHFLLMTGAGLDAQIVYRLDIRLKRRFGKLAYWHAGFKELGGHRPRFRTIVNGEEFEGSFTLITRVRNYGGDFEIARRVKLTDNDFEVVIFEKDHWRDYMRFLGAVMLDRLHNTDGVAIRRASKVELLAPEDSRIFLQTDGEGIGLMPATITTVPGALNLLLPQRYADK